MNHVTHLVTSADISIFSKEFSKFCYIKKYRYRLHFSTEFLIILDFFASLKICLINLVIISMMSAKMATPGLLKIMVFWNKGYDVIISVNDATNKILSRDLNCIADGLMWSKFGIWVFYERSYHNLNFIRIWSEKPLFWRAGLSSSSITWDWY